MMAIAEATEDYGCRDAPSRGLARRLFAVNPEGVCALFLFFALSAFFAGSARAEESLEQLMARGKAVYDASCSACHQANGQGITGAFPAVAGGSVSVGPIGEHMKIVLYGKPGTAMVGFGQQLSDADAAALVTYERNAWGNDALLAEGSVKVVQPADVAAYRNGGG